MIFKRGPIFAAGHIAWSNETGAGIKFYRDSRRLRRRFGGLPLAQPRRLTLARTRSLRLERPMLDSWTYVALTGVAALAGFIDFIAGGGGLIVILSPALGRRSAARRARHQQASVGVRDRVALRNYWRSGVDRMATQPPDRGVLRRRGRRSADRAAYPARIPQPHRSRCCWSPRFTFSVAADDG